MGRRIDAKKHKPEPGYAGTRHQHQKWGLGQARHFKGLGVGPNIKTKPARNLNSQIIFF